MTRSARNGDRTEVAVGRQGGLAPGHGAEDAAGGAGSGGSKRSGVLVLVATPIGNLGDLSPRAQQALRDADLICCEDTRRTRGLLAHAGIGGRGLLAVHEHNERIQTPRVLDHLAGGAQVALVSDAGTPGISDPGSWLVARVAEAGYEVSIVPGPSAGLAALVVSGLPAARFCFEGFLPRRGAERRERLQAIADDERTTVLHEAPTRLARTLADLVAVCGEDRPVAVVREITKIHEEVWRGTLAVAADEFIGRQERGAVRGEIVIVVGGAPQVDRELTDEQVKQVVISRLQGGASVRDAAAAAGALGVSRRRAYDLALEVASTSEYGASGIG